MINEQTKIKGQRNKLSTTKCSKKIADKQIKKQQQLCKDERKQNT